MSKILEMIEKRNKAWEGAKAFLESKRDKDGLISEEDALVYDEMEKKVHNFSLEIERLQKMEELDKELSKPTSNAIVTKPMKVDEKEEKKGRARDEYKNAMLNALRTNFKRVENVLQEGVDADGGYLVPDEYDDRLIETLEEENIMRSLGTTITTSGQHKINIAMSDPAAAWIEEGGALNFGDSKFAQVLLDAHNGDGNGKPTGIFNKTNGGTYLKDITAVKSDDLIDLIHALKRPYRKNATFIMNDKTIAQVRKLKDNNGAYIWQPSYQEGEPDRILGYPVKTSAFAPENAIAFGDFSYYNIGDRGARSFKELTELFAGNGMIGFVAKERVDGKLVLKEAVQILPIKATS